MHVHDVFVCAAIVPRLFLRLAERKILQQYHEFAKIVSKVKVFM